MPTNTLVRILLTIPVFCLGFSMGWNPAILAFSPSDAEGWNPRLAANYLDSRQKEWAAWPPAAGVNGPCLSCHTGMTYLLARPALRRVLNENQPTQWETSILTRMKANAGKESPGPLQSVETIFAALFLAAEPNSPSGALSQPAQRAFAQLWLLQIQQGQLKGAWPWYSANLDPWETPSSLFYGASLAGLAIGSAPSDHRKTPEIQRRIQALERYLHSGMDSRPLHSRLALLWASTALPDLLAEPERKAILDEAITKQRSDGSWTIAPLGPWDPHPDAPSSAGGDSYATGFTAYVLTKAGVTASDSALARSRAWLKSQQDRKTGAWPDSSMNKKYPAGSMQERFQQDAATAFAALALIEAGDK